MPRTDARLAILATAALVFTLSTGCTTLLKQGYYTATGAKGSFYEVQVVDPAVLTTYRAVRFVPFTNELGAVVPDEVFEAVNRDVPQAVEEDLLFYPTGKTLRVEGRLIHYSGQSGLIGAASAIIGGDNNCVCRIQLRDDETGDMIGEGVCWAAVKSAIRRGPDEYGQGVGKGLSKWLTLRMPAEERTQRREDLKPE